MVGVSFDKDFFPSPLSTEYKKSSKGQVIELKKKKNDHTAGMGDTEIGLCVRVM